MYEEPDKIHKDQDDRKQQVSAAIYGDSIRPTMTGLETQLYNQL